MTRDEAIDKVESFPGDGWASKLVDALAALGLLQFDDPLPADTDAARTLEGVLVRGWDVGAATAGRQGVVALSSDSTRAIITRLVNAGFKITR